MRAGLAALPGAPEIAGVDGGRSQCTGLADVRSVVGPPSVAGVDAVGFGRGIVLLLERIAPVDEGACPVGQGLKLPRFDLGGVLRALGLSHFGDGAVEAGDLCMEAVDDASQQARALVGELRRLDGDAVHDAAVRFAEGCCHVTERSCRELA